MPSFLDERTTRLASSLKGPRVYSTDLLPSLFDWTNPNLSVDRTARALKIKIITKGIVTLNCAHLVTPAAVQLLKRYPDLLEGDALLPAFRVGKENLEEVGDVTEAEFAAAGIDRHEFNDYISILEESIKTIMPWELGDVGEQFRRSVLAGLENRKSLVSRRLASASLKVADREKLAAEIKEMDLSENATLRRHIQTLPARAQRVLNRYTSACYHMVGTGVVRCETGTDLSPLSDFKATDVLLASSDATPALLSEEGIFLRAFMGHALDTIQAMMLPTQIIDVMSFKDVHALSAALREQGFQEKYEAILGKCAETLAVTNPAEALDQFDPEALSEVARQIAVEFQRYIDGEVYRAKEHDIDVADGYRSGTDLALDGLTAIPVVGQIISVAQAVGHAGKVAKAGWSSYRTMDTARALEAARVRREKEIQEAIKKLSTGDSKKSQLLDAAAAFTDIYQIRVRRA